MWFEKRFKHSLDIAILRLTTGTQVQARKLSDALTGQLSNVAGLETTKDFKVVEHSVLTSLAAYRMLLVYCRELLVMTTTGKDPLLKPITNDFMVIDLAVVEFVAGMLHETFKSPHLSELCTNLTILHRALSWNAELVDETLSNLKQSKAPNAFWPVSKSLFGRIGDADDVPSQVGTATCLQESALALLDSAIATILESPSENLRSIIMS